MSDEKIDNVSVFECKCGCKIEHMVYEDDECPYCGSMRNETGIGYGNDGIDVIINKDANIRYISIGNFEEECEHLLKDENHSCINCNEDCDYFIPCPLCTNDEIYDIPFRFVPVGWFDNGRKEIIDSKYNEIDKYTEDGMAEKLRGCYSAGDMHTITVRGVNQVEIEQGCKFCNGTGKVDWIQNITKDRRTDD